MICYGMDYASWQGRPDFPKLEGEGITFAITKVTGEGNYVNPYWHENTIAARFARIVSGFYDWVEPQGWANDGDGTASAHDYAGVITPALQPGDLICVDFETPQWNIGPLGTAIESAFKAYMFGLRDTLVAPIIIYTGPYFLDETGAREWTWLTEANGFYLWEAAPGAGMLPDDAGWLPVERPFTKPAIFHQHQWYATSDAVVGQFDRDRFQGTADDLARYGVPNHFLSKAPLNPSGTLAAALAQIGGDVKEPAEGKYTAYINDDGAAIVVLNFGGKTGRIAGVAIKDVGVTVESATEPGVLEDRSFKDEAAQPWNERRAS